MILDGEDVEVRHNYLDQEVSGDKKQKTVVVWDVIGDDFLPSYIRILISQFNIRIPSNQPGFNGK